MEEYLLISYHQDRLEGADKVAVETWLAESPENQATYAQCIRIWLHAGQAGVLEGLDVEGDLEEVRGRIGGEPAFVKRKSGWGKWMWRVAATLVLGAGMAWAAWQWTQGGASTQMLVVETGENPGEPFALADGSRVRLNAHSKLEYPEHFEGDRREVKLSGEAWFKVDSDPEHPFTIRHGNSQTEVLGTEFDIRAYPEEAGVTVSVYEGVVRLSMENDLDGAVVLREGEVGEIANGNATRSFVKGADLNLDSWRTGKLIFDSTPLTTVIDVFERHFDVDIELEESPDMGACLLSASFESVEVEEAIDMIGTVFNAEWRINGREITILHVNC